jgi:hypothetical protein
MWGIYTENTLQASSGIRANDPSFQAVNLKVTDPLYLSLFVAEDLLGSASRTT